MQAYEQDAIQDYKSFLAGYLTAYNTVTNDTYQATGQNALGDNLKLLHEHCAGHRLDSFERAIQALLTTTHDQRHHGAQGQAQGWGRPSPQAPPN